MKLAGIDGHLDALLLRLGKLKAQLGVLRGEGEQLSRQSRVIRHRAAISLHDGATKASRCWLD
ncbi:hypothetical protein MOX02_46720 [Methylobacterium oxalidis]|uniref:Uncharacterized protein n=1 Tax=Methylobacterium oxalidis TaxID=944322 RepID=A0A512J9I9_9HYPH|nr:hypothetical protein MOX02_46720 [Methylobacterium oxalidis]GLS66248.1 hypothetical protein GCM10007888_46300 [Methylobacterium oxalidis]